MAKELPYFKFEPSQWDTGNIQLCSREDKGLFIDICSIYWQRLGDLPIKLAVQKLCAGNATALNPLIDSDIIKVIDGLICIDFLNEQLSEFENVSEQNSKNALEGWKKRRKNATASNPQSGNNAIREEKIKEDKKRREESAPDLDQFEKWTNHIIDGTDFFFSQKFKNKFPSWGGAPETFVAMARSHLELLNRYPNMNPNTQERFRNSLLKHCEELISKSKTNGTGKKGFDIDGAKNSIADYIANNS